MGIVFVIVAIIIIVCVKRKCKQNEAVDPSKVMTEQESGEFTMPPHNQEIKVINHTFKPEEELKFQEE